MITLASVGRPVAFYQAPDHLGARWNIRLSTTDVVEDDEERVRDADGDLLVLLHSRYKIKSA